MERSPHALLMTANIKPSPLMGETLRSDANVRLNDYCDALRWYLELPDEIIDRIVILENSQADLTPFGEIARQAGSGKRLELLSTSSDAPPERGKGYAESLMIEEGLRRSKLLKPHSHFWKVTGRIRVLNLASLVRTAPLEFDLYCDLRNVPFIGESLGGNQWMDTRLFATTPAAYISLFGGQADCDYVIEKGYYLLVRAAMKAQQLKIYPRFRQQPVLSGVSGHSGASYRSTSYRVKGLIRTAGRLFAPALWL